MSRLGQLLYGAYYKPAGQIKELRRRGLYWSARSWAGGRQLRKIVQDELSRAEHGMGSGLQSSGPTFVYLGGSANFDLLYASIASLHVHWPVRPNVALLSDGTLTGELGRWFEGYFPSLKVFSSDEVDISIERMFPKARFPELRALRDRFLLARKFMDICVVPSQWIVFVDADTLFLRRPDDLVQWASRPTTSFYMADRRNAYGYPICEMQALLRSPLLECVNTGLFSLQPSAANWQEVEEWYLALSGKFPDSHFVEQSLLAMMFSQNGAEQLPADYICEPDEQQVASKQGCFHHYVWPCRHFLFGGAWKQPVAELKARRASGAR